MISNLDFVNFNLVEIKDFRLEFYDEDAFYGFPNTSKVIDHIYDSYKPKISLEEKDWSIKQNIEGLDLLNNHSCNTIWYEKWEE